PVTVQQHHICFVIDLLMCNSTLRRPLPRICGTAEQLHFGFSFYSGINLDGLSLCDLLPQLIRVNGCLPAAIFFEQSRRKSLAILWREQPGFCLLNHPVLLYKIKLPLNSFLF
ncbi:MAG: hypothetical protein ACYC6S_00705, partial [Desulfobulbia bacterium]